MVEANVSVREVPIVRECNLAPLQPTAQSSDNEGTLPVVEPIVELSSHAETGFEEFRRLEPLYKAAWARLEALNNRR